MKRIVALTLALVMVLGLCAACGKQDEQQTDENFESYAGAAGTSADNINKSQVVKLLYSDEVSDWNPLHPSAAGTYANWIDTLVEYDNYGMCQPCLAESWTKSEDGTVWTFKIREGVQWQRYDGSDYGAETVAEDWVTSVKWILDPANTSRSADKLFDIVGAEDYYMAKERGENPDFETVGFKAISKYVDAKTVVVTNVFRDQLDRYGEVTHTLENIRIGVSNSKNAVLCLNADDSISGSLAGMVDNPLVYYGVDTPIYKSRVSELSDAPYCHNCKHEYVYDYVTYGHLGGFRCPNCGNSRPVPQISVKEVVSSDAEQSQVIIAADGVEYPTTINLPGGYNIYNACAAMACGKAMGLDLNVVSKSLSGFACGFGRMEKFDIDGVSLRMILIKNPAGCNQVLNFLTDIKEPFVFTTCLNDRTQDGKDVSWIWDVDFERLVEMENLERIFVSGVRADDMAMRFQYAGFPVEKITVIRDYGELTKACIATGKPVFIMPTYTAMLDLRGTISKNYGFKAFWE